MGSTSLTHIDMQVQGWAVCVKWGKKKKDESSIPTTTTSLLEKRSGERELIDVQIHLPLSHF